MGGAKWDELRWRGCDKTGNDKRHSRGARGPLSGVRAMSGGVALTWSLWASVGC